MKQLLALVVPLALASCTMTLPGSPYTLGKQPSAGELSPTGTVTGRVSGDTVRTEVRVMGLKPNQFYVAHYHLQGPASPEPCQSGGPAIMSSKIVGMTDASGMLMLSGTAPYADVMNATYFNIHTASDAQGTLADPGVACTSVRVM